MIKIYICLCFKHPLSLSELNKTLILSTDFRECSNIKFHKNPSRGSRVIPCRQADG